MTQNHKQTFLNFYKQWMKEKSFSPALKEKVYITFKGWNHIVGNKNNRKRSKNDVYRRLKLLIHAKEIINTSTTIQNVITKYGNVYYALEAMRLVDNKNGKEWRKVRVILEEDKLMRKIFLSVMDKKQKSPQKKAFQNNKKK